MGIVAQPYLTRRVLLLLDNDPNAPATLHASPRVRGPSQGNPFDQLMQDLVINAGVALASAASSAYENWRREKRAKEMAELGIVVSSVELAARELSFPPGHPARNAGYAGHPLIPTRYLPVEAFHPTLFEEKANELMTVLAALGAKRVRVKYAHGYKSVGGFSFSGSVPVQGPLVGADANGGISHSVNFSGHFEETFEPRGEPRLPDGLVWFTHEPSWQAIARRRIELNAKSFHVSLCYDEDYGINGTLGAKIDQLAGLKIAGSFRAFQSTAWEFDGEYA